MTSRRLKSEIDRLEKRLDYNFQRMGVGSSDKLSNSPVVQSNLAGLIGASFVGGLMLGILSPYLRGKSPRPITKSTAQTPQSLNSSQAGPDVSITVEDGHSSVRL